MFESLVSGSIDPEIIKLLKLVKQALVGVESRLVAQVETGEPVRMLAASAQLDAVHAWSPAIDDLLRKLETPVKPAVAMRIPPHKDH